MMSSLLPAVAFLDNKRRTGPVHRSILALDLEGSTTRTDPVKGELRRVMYDLLGHSLEETSIASSHVEQMSDRGDGVLVLVKPHDEVPKAALLDRLIPLLTAFLNEYNAQAARPELQMRLRAVVHAGEVNIDRRGFYGESVDIACRLLDSPAVKRALRESPAPLVLVVSEDIYSGIVRHGCANASGYLPRCRVRVAGRQHRGYVHIPVAGARPAATPLAGKRIERQVAAVIGRALGTSASPAAG
jgi:hypothetical protein